VEVVGRTPRATLRAVQEAGGRVLGKVRTLVLADVPLQRLEPLENRADVLFIRLPQRVDEPVTASRGAASSASGLLAMMGPKGQEVLAKTGVAAWHAAGYTGSGVRIGIIDGFNLAKWQNAMANGEIAGMPAGTFCRQAGADCSGTFWGGGDHGVGVAEVVSDMAPGATLYLASAVTAADLQAAVDYFKSQGVRIITRSLTARYDGPGNGAGPIGDVIANAVNSGIAWFNSAGNSAGDGGVTDGGTYFRQQWFDPDNDRWMDFGVAGDEFLGFTCTGYLLNGLRWSDWLPTGRTDYDVYVYEEPNDATLISQSLGDQGAGQPPIETGFGCTNNNDADFLKVWRFTNDPGPAGDVIEFMTNDIEVEHASNPYSGTGPAADSNNAGAVSVGAVDPVNGTTIAVYSAQGPSNDNRIKPDLSAAAGMSSLTYGSFSGTSAATPAAAGAAAVVLGANPSFTPAQLVASIKASVVDRGAAGPDNVYGAGELLLPAPPASSTPPPPPPPAAAQVAVTSGYAVPILRKLKENFPVQVRWKVNGTQSSATVWRSLNKNDFTEGAAVGTKKRVRVKMVLGKSNQYAIRAADPAGALSDWFYTRLYHPRVIDDKDAKVKYAKGWRHIKVKGAWKHTLTSSAGSHGSARLRFKGSSVSLVMFRSANSGKVKVYLDGKAIGKINLRSNKVQAKRIVANIYYKKRGTHVIELEPLTTGGRGQVFLDGFLVLG
jgi:subtilisin family serine protease